MRETRLGFILLGLILVIMAPLYASAWEADCGTRGRPAFAGRPSQL